MRDLRAPAFSVEFYMPRYFFDIHDGRSNHGNERDDEGVICDSPEAAARYTRRFLPEIAAHEVETEENDTTYTVLVRDNEGYPIYTAALYFVGSWLIR
jgi:hypothetical protein